MQQKLTKSVVESLRPRAARYVVHDSIDIGFLVRVGPDGVKTFYVMYRAGKGRSAPKRWVRLGRFGEQLTVDQARAEARQMLARIRANANDPAAAITERKRSPTVAVLGQAYLDHVRAHLKPNTVKEYARLWKKDTVPRLGTKLVTEVTRSDVSSLHRSMRDRPYVANRVLALLGAFFSYAEAEGRCPKHFNPAHEVKFFREESRETFLSKDAVANLGAALSQAETVGVPPAPNRRRKRVIGDSAKHRPKSADALRPANLYAVAAIRFLLLTGWREREALDLQWQDVDLAKGKATLRDSKTGRSVRMLGSPACVLLSELPRVPGSPYVFPGKTPDAPLVEINRVWYAVRHAAGLTGVRLHDLRHTYASVTASTGRGSLLLIGRLLGHTDTTTTQKYAHLFDDPVKAAADATADALANWLSSTPNIQLVTDHAQQRAEGPKSLESHATRARARARTAGA
jgi:integrase